MQWMKIFRVTGPLALMEGGSTCARVCRLPGDFLPRLIHSNYYHQTQASAMPKLDTLLFKWAGPAPRKIFITGNFASLSLSRSLLPN